MVKIIDLKDDLVNEEDADSTDDSTTEEQGNGMEADMEETPPKPTDPTSAPLSPDAFLALYPSVPEADAGPSLAPEDSREHTFSPGIIPPPLSVRPTRYLWDVNAQYGHHAGLQRSLRGHRPMRQSGRVGLSRWAFELQQLADPLNATIFACRFRAPQMCDEPEPPTETKSVRAAETPNSETASCNDKAVGKEDCKTDSDESTKEKSDGPGEKVELAATAKAGPISSPDLSDELSDMSDSFAPPDYETLQVELNAEYTRTGGIEYTSTSLTGRPWTTVREIYTMDLDSELTNSIDGKEPPECSEEGEAACLPANSFAKDCWEQWVDDDALFKLDEDMYEPSTSAGVRMPSPPSPATERRRVKFENRQQAREQERTAKPAERMIFVPTEKIGRILGKGGRQIREIERITGANIKVEHRQSNKPVTQLTLTGTEEQISKADEEICIIIRNYKPLKSGEAATTSVSSQEENELKRLLIGIKNQVIDAEKRCRKP